MSLEEATMHTTHTTLWSDAPWRRPPPVSAAAEQRSLLPWASFAPVDDPADDSQPRLLRVLSLWRRRARQRRALLLLDDRLLRDIGLTRWEVERHARVPFWREAPGDE
jgi:uncharacterized protein YjiS (DUF1127 family)